MSVSAVAPTPFYQDPERLAIGMPEARTDETKSAGGEGKKIGMFAEGDDSPSFWDLLDVINPLQHIPVINTLYRELTGDQIGMGARLVGGTLFGGPLGLIAAAGNAVIEESTGKDVGGHMLALLRDEAPDAPDATATQYATTQPSAQPAAASADAVSSSPAQAEAAEAAAPVIALPEGKGGTGPAMMFGLDGIAPAPQAAVTQAPLPPAPAPVTLAQAEPAVAQAGRMMPVPNRNNTNPMPLQPLSVPVSTSSTRSNVPITGRAPNAAVGVAPTRVLAGQEVPADHPMAPPAGEQVAADWFTAAWSQALDKYQRTSQTKAQPTTSIVQ
jgi:pyruvate/2-oxoglutarate dehydrogenase complex dihydrolipoamide acyltransferase (E2) component